MSTSFLSSVALLVLCLVAVPSCPAGEASVERVDLIRSPQGWCAQVVVHHDDVDYQHYANWVEVLTGDGVRLIRRDIVRPSTGPDRPPFHRIYLDALPSGLKGLVVRAHCKVHSYGGREVAIDLSSREGEGYTVGRKKVDVLRDFSFRGEGDFMRSWLRRYVTDSDGDLNDPDCPPPPRGRLLVNPRPDADSGEPSDR